MSKKVRWWRVRTSSSAHRFSPLIGVHVQSAAAYIPSQIFDEFAYSPPIRPPSISPTPPVPSQTEEATVLEFPLHTFIDSLSIFSTGPAPSVTEGRAQNRRWVRDRENAGDDDAPRGRIEAYFGATTGKSVGMRLSYAGEGHPLSLLMCVSFSLYAPLTHDINDDAQRGRFGRTGCQVRGHNIHGRGPARHVF